MLHRALQVAELDHALFVKIIYQQRAGTPAGLSFEVLPVWRKIEASFTKVAQKMAVWKIDVPIDVVVQRYQFYKLFPSE
jgi:hypothetical protein